MENLTPLDWVVLILLVVAVVRGLAIGVVREVFSLAALAAAIVAVRTLGEPVAEWLAHEAALGRLVARIVAGVALAAGSIAGVALVGGLLRQGLRAAGLGLWDRLAGGVLGAVEGGLVAALLLLGASLALGRDHPLLVHSRSVSALERIETFGGGALPGRADVAAPPRSRR